MFKKPSAFISLSFAILLITGCGASNTEQLPSNETTSTDIVETSETEDISPSANTSSEEERIFSWVLNRCGDEHAPDLPVRVFRDSDGLINLILSSPTNYRMTGTDFDSLKVDCNAILRSHTDPDPAQFNFKEWMGATYTFDGETIYALIHNEYHGINGSDYYAQRDFNSEQGKQNWYYRGWDGSKYSEMKFSSKDNRWEGKKSLCQIGNQWAHPDNQCNPTRTWVSPFSESITITGSAKDYDPNGGDGVIVTILKNNQELWSATIENGDTNLYTYDLETTVEPGDEIHFRVDQRGNSNNDTTYFNPKINVGPDPCPSEEHWQCQMISITYGLSTDGGKTFTHPEAPSHYIASQAIQYAPDWGLNAIWQPSNIVKNPNDGYHYFLVLMSYAPNGQPGHFQRTCVVQSQTIDDPTSWRAWGGKAFDVQFANPYLEKIDNPTDYNCAMVGPNLAVYSLTYNTFFEKFIAVGQASGNVAVNGFYYMLSDDLVNWSKLYLLMPAEFSYTTDGPFLAYPSLVDHDSDSINFETTGQEPYLYFSKFQTTSLENVDLYRVQIHFEK